MKQIINTRKVIKNLQKNNLKILDEARLHRLISNFNFVTVLYGYSSPFFKLDNKNYDQRSDSEQIISLYDYDRTIANEILRYILLIEKRLNTAVAYSIINHYKINDYCLFKLDQKFLQKQVFKNINLIEPKINYENFMRKILKYCESNEFTKVYEKKDKNNIYKKWSDCPLVVMCLSWSFATTFSIFIALEDRVQKSILSSFGLDEFHFQGFVDLFKNFLRLRNMISHNYVIYRASFKYQTQALFDLYEYLFQEKISVFELPQMLKMIEYFSYQTNLLNKCKNDFENLPIDNYFKSKINIFHDPQYQDTESINSEVKDLKLAVKKQIKKKNQKSKYFDNNNFY